MKDAKPFNKATLQLELVPVGSSSSLAITTWQDAGTDESNEPLNVDETLKILENQFGSVGASHTELKREYVAVTGKSESTFARVVRKLKTDPRVRYEGKRYFAIPKADGVTVKSVSSGVMTATAAEVSCHPLS